MGHRSETHLSQHAVIHISLPVPTGPAAFFPKFIEIFDISKLGVHEHTGKFTLLKDTVQ